MSATYSLDSLLFALSRACVSPFATFVQIQGCFICLLLALGWALAAYVRNREIKQMKNSMKGGNSLAFLSHEIEDLEHSKQVLLPRVTVVMPLKGFGEHNLHNWRSQITTLYGGPVEFLFMVESTEDPAYGAVSKLLKDFEDEVEAKILVAGHSTTCSQKIHNQLIGAEEMHKDSKYILFLDDDVRLHPGTIGALTAEMEKNPEIFIQTGYPLDLPSGSLGSYCIYEYHMPCSMGFATGGRTFFLWGGCMMMHADDFRKDNFGVVSGLRDGGYSDDMTLAAIAGNHKRLISSPPVALFPHPLSSDLSFGRYWNYLRKQTFVLESYVSKVNWFMNRALFYFHCYLSWGFVAPFIMALIHVAAALRIYFSDDLIQKENFSYKGLMLIGLLATCTMIELLSMWNLTRIEVQLCNMLPPEASPLSLASYKWCLSPEREKSGARTKRKSPNEGEFSWNEAASGCERRNGAAIKSERFYGRRDRSVASTEEKVSWVNEGFLRLPKSELMIVAWLTSLLDGLNMPTSSVGTSAKLEITSELRFTKFRECDIDEEDCS